MLPKTMTGARAQVFVDNVLVGVFDSCSYAVNIGAEPVHLLGRHSAAEIAITSYEAVTVNCSGYRIVGNGAHVLPKAPRLQDLLNAESIQLSVVDRQSGELIGIVDNCTVINNSGGYNAKATSRIQITYLGTLFSDESGQQVESAGATELP